MCHNKCDIVATLETRKACKGEADSKSPRGRVCPRGKNRRRLCTAKRILHPLIRCGEKGKEDSAAPHGMRALTFASRGFLDIIRKHGPQALASYYGGAVWRTA
ncbi:MAG: hypothetical protein ACLR0U_20250 [Enterocloster clostridioformis]